MHRRPAPLPALLLGGALVCGAFVFLQPGALWWCGGIALVVMGWLSCSRNRATIFLTGLVAGLLTGFLYRPVPLASTLLDGLTRKWIGEVEQVRQQSGAQKCIVVLRDGARVNVILSGLNPEVRAHDLLEFSGIAEAADKYEQAGIPEVSVRTALDKRIAASIYVEPLKYRIAGHCLHFTEPSEGIADKLSHYIYTSGLDPEASALLCSAWLGRDDIAPDFRQSVRALGLSHLLCVSGMHVGLVALVIMLMIYPLNYFRRHAYIRYLFIVIPVWLYVCLTGLQASAFRAAVMITVFYIVEYLQFSRNTLNTLCLAASVVVLFNPWWIFAVGFQLSVLAVAGIVLLVPFLNPFTGTHHARSAKIANAVVLPVAVTIATLPVVLYHFNSISLVSVPTNILAALIFPLFMFAGIVAVMLLHGGIGWAAKPVNAFSDLLGRTCEVGDPMAEGLHLSDSRLAMMLVLLTLIFVLVRYTNLRWRVPGVGLGAAAMIALAVLPYPAPREVVMYSDGKHFTALISGQARPLYVSTRLRPRPSVPYRRYFALRGYDPDSLTLLRPGFGNSEIALRDSTLTAGHKKFNLRQLSRRNLGQVVKY